MTWRRRWLSIPAVILVILSSALVSPTSAAVSQASLLSGLDNDKGQLAVWSAQVNGLGNLVTARTPLLADLASVSSAVSTLRFQASGRLSQAALNAAFTTFLSLQREVWFEGAKVHLALVANAYRGKFFGDVSKLAIIGGSNPPAATSGPLASVRADLQAANSELNQAVSLLTGATAANYPADSTSIGAAQSILNEAAAHLSAAERLLAQMPVAGAGKAQVELKLWLLTVSTDLSRLRTEVVGSPDLTAAEKQNLLAEINADLVAFNQVYNYLAQGGHGRAMVDELARILAAPGVFILIFPKADIMLAAGADRSAIASLSGLVANLQSRINGSAANGADVSNLKSLMADLKAHLAVAAADIEPIDSEFEPMVAITSTQRSNDAQVITSAMNALHDAATNIAAARAEAIRIMSATA